MRFYSLSKYILRKSCRSVSTRPSIQSQKERKLTAHEPATLATIPPLIAIGLNPLVLLNTAPLIAPATTEFVISCFPLQYPIVLLVPLYTIATTPAEFPRKGPLLVTAFNTPFNRNLAGIDGGFFCSPSAKPHAPPTVSALR
jgi:hypothetical protein